MKSITELAIEKYPPKGIKDAQDWQHDENAELRKAYIKGAEDLSHEVLRTLNPNFDTAVETLSDIIAKNQKDVMSSINANYVELKQNK